MALFYTYVYARKVGGVDKLYEEVYFYANSRVEADQQYEEEYGTEPKNFLRRDPS